MKINRFKIYEVDKFKIQKNSIFFDILKKQKEIKILESQAEELIKEWIKLNFDSLKLKHFSIKGDYTEYVQYLGYELHPWSNGSEYVCEIKTPSSSWTLDKSDFADLMSYIEDPSIYDDRKIYNL